MTLNRSGILLINLGTPQAPDKPSVRAFLAEFLNDPHVIDLPAALRSLLVRGLILPFRSQSSMHAYQKIWGTGGSPLLMHSRQLSQALSLTLGEGFSVELGMRYGQPSIHSALQRLRERGCRNLIILPLFPQYSKAATGSALEKALQELQKNSARFTVTWIDSFFDDPGFIDAWRTLITEQLPAEEPQMWIFSYHGLPVRHVEKSGCSPNCLAIPNCAVNDNDANRLCYRRQCFITSRLLAQALKLAPNQYRVAFQSRLGRTPWITPYTDKLLIELAEQKIKRIGIVSPSFVADCLETLEELNIRAREQWWQLTGGELTVFPCLNAHEAWVSALSKMILKLSHEQRSI